MMSKTNSLLVLATLSFTLACQGLTTDCDRLKEPAVKAMKLRDEFITGRMANPSLTANRSQEIARSLEVEIIPQLQALKLSDPTLQRIQKEMVSSLSQLKESAQLNFPGRKNGTDGFAIQARDPSFGIAYIEAENYCSDQ